MKAQQASNKRMPWYGAFSGIVKLREGLLTSQVEMKEHTGEFPKGVGHRVENGWGLTKVAVVLLNGLIW